MEELLKKLIKKVDKNDELGKKVDKIDGLAKKVDKIEELAKKVDKIDELFKKVDDLAVKTDKIDGLANKIDGLEQNMNHRFEQVDKRLDNMAKDVVVIKEQTAFNMEDIKEVELSKNSEFKFLDKKVDFFVSKVSDLEFKVNQLGGQK